MTNATPAILAGLLVLSLPAMTAVAADPSGTDDGSGASLHYSQPQLTPPAEFDETTNRLALTGDVRST